MTGFRGASLRNMLAHVTDGLYSLIPDIVSFVLLLMAGSIEFLWNGKSLQEAVAWRSKLERATQSGTHEVVNDWESHGLSFPVSPDKVKAELVKARNHENSLRRRKKVVIVILLSAGAFFWFFARYLSALGA